MTTLLTTAQLRAKGLDSRGIARQVRAGGLTRLRPGLYSMDADASITTCHREVLAHYLKASPESVASHWSAAVLHGLVEPDEAQGRLWVTRPGRAGGQRRATVVEARAALHTSEVTVVDDMPTTSLARTALDLARSEGLALGLQLTDQVVLKVGRTELKRVLARGARRPGQVAAAQSVRHANWRSPDRAHSKVRARLLEAGLPQPQVAAPILDHKGEQLGTAPFVWPAFGVAAFLVVNGAGRLRVAGPGDGAEGLRAAGLGDGAEGLRATAPGGDADGPQQMIARQVPGTREHSQLVALLARYGWWVLHLDPESSDRASLQIQFRDARLLAARLRWAMGEGPRWPDVHIGAPPAA